MNNLCVLSKIFKFLKVFNSNFCSSHHITNLKYIQSTQWSRKGNPTNQVDLL